VASPGSLVLFIVPRFTQATFAKARAMKQNETEASVATCLNGRYGTEQAQLMLTTPRDAFRGQSRSPNTASLDMLGMHSY